MGMTINISTETKNYEFYYVPEKVGKAIITLLNECENEASMICSAESERQTMGMTIDEAKEPTNDLGVDCISRETTVKRLCNLAEYMNEHKENSGDPYRMAALFIQDNKTEFPSVTPQEPRWIPTSERLPEEKDYSRCAENYDGAVYWCTDKGVIGIGWYYEDTKSWAWLDDTFPDHWGKVVAWIPLPKPYKMEREDKE